MWPELQEIRGGRLSSIPTDALEHEFVHAFRGVVPNETRFLGGESIGELFDRVLPALERLLADDDWDTVLPSSTAASTARSSPTRSPGERMFLGHFEQAPGCVNVLDVGDEWIVRAVNVSPPDLLHRATPDDDDGALLGAVPGATGSAEDAPADGDGAGDAGPVGRRVSSALALRRRT